MQGVRPRAAKARLHHGPTSPAHLEFNRDTSAEKYMADHIIGTAQTIKIKSYLNGGCRWLQMLHI
jgi:hypothetical protein